MIKLITMIPGNTEKYLTPFIVCLRSITIGTSCQSQLACHIRVDLQKTGEGRSHYGIAIHVELDLGPLLKIYTIYCLLTFSTSRQSQLACHIRVDLQNTGKARIASPDGIRGSRGH